MAAAFKITIDGWPNGNWIPEEYAFCMQADEGHIAMARNRNPRIAWSGVPAGAKSLAIICHDSDVPSKPDDVNKEGVTVPVSLPRVDFYHWVLVDVPVGRHEILAGEDSHGITAGGKPLGRTEYGVRGLNNYTDWFASDPDMKGDYGGYDGPCPPWNDEIVHHYHFTVYVLDVSTLGLSGRFGGPEALKAMQGHILDQASWIGKYSLNPMVHPG